MAYDIGPRVGVEGESEFVSDIKRIRESIKTLGAQMDVVTTSYLNSEKSVESLAREQAILERQIALTKEKIADQATMAGKSAAKYGEAAAETQKWEQALAESQSELNKLKSKLSGVEREMDELGNETEDVEVNLKDAGEAGLKFGDVLKANVLSDAITGGIRALGSAIKSAVSGLVDFAKSGVEVASDLEEVQNVVDVTFGEQGAKTIETFAQKAASSFGMSALSAKNFTGTLGAMLKSMGLSEDAVLDMSTDLVGLAGDLASFYNLDVSEAFAKIRSGISGETEPLKQLGINMSVANLEAYALAQGIEKAYKDMTQAEQATLRYSYLMQAAADAQGDFARTSDSYANQQKVMQLNMENLSAAIGGKLLPYLTELTGALNGLLSGETSMQEFVQQIGQMVSDVAQKIVEGLPELLEAGGQMFSSIFDGLRDAWPEITEAALEIIGMLLDGLTSGLPELLQGGFDMLMTVVDGIIEGIPDMIARLPQIITDLVVFLLGNLPRLVTAGGKLLGGIAEGLIKAIPELVKQLPTLILAIANGITDLLWSVINIGADIVKGIWKGIQSMGTWIKDKVKGFFGGIVDGIKDLLGIHSPSKVFAGLGGYMAEGLGVGFGQEIKNVQRDIDRSMAGLISDVPGSVGVSGCAPGVGGGHTAGGLTAEDLRKALSGMALYMGGRKVGALVSVSQANQARATGVPVALG